MIKRTSRRRGASWNWVLRRLGLGVLVLWVVSVIVFMATQLLPSDPARAILGKYATPERVEALRETLGLNRPAIVQYGDWLFGVVRGDFGTSLASRGPVSDLLGVRLTNSLSLMLIVAVLMIIISIVVGIVLAIRRDGATDQVVNGSFLAMMALPDFVIGSFVLLLLSTAVFTLFPAASIIPTGDSPFQHPELMALPVITLLLATVPFLARLVRASMIDILDSDYVSMARLRGLPERTVIWRHAVPNAVVPAAQGTAMMLGYLLGGVVVVEYVFNYPGLGGALNAAVAQRDLPVIQAVTLVFAAGVVLFNLLADVVTVLLTPKLRTRS
ncbi:ABC transporter permease [Leifsonia shinshuensis]|uniref:ABC transporter permease n=2 Tax=Leifsonia shinshuensis TaxID=150026 RepID=A0A7G6YGM8_9MICO|nr:ABC transporter permease [Leifsonia shinshuensis]